MWRRSKGRPSQDDLRKGGRDIKIAVNAGGLKPQQLAKQIRELLHKYGDVGRSVKVAWVTGDNVLDQLKNPKSSVKASIQHLTYGTSLDEWGYELITANTYTGCCGMRHLFRFFSKYFIDIGWWVFSWLQAHQELLRSRISNRRSSC